MSTLLFSQI